MLYKKAILVVDLQNDFCPGGALGVREGDKIIPVVNKYVDLFIKNKYSVFISRDWHPADSNHFEKSGGQWPSHCVQNTKGAKFHPDFNIPEKAIIVSKGTDTELDGYSVFEAKDSTNIPFIELLKKKGVKELYICGIATDYCIKMTALDALKNGYKVNVLTDAIKGVDGQDSKLALEDIAAKKGKLITYSEVIKELDQK